MGPKTHLLGKVLCFVTNPPPQPASLVDIVANETILQVLH